MVNADSNNDLDDNERIFIALGGNIGNREAYLQTGLSELEKFSQVIACSTFINTKAVGGEPGQDDYLNAVAEIHTQLPPLELLQKMLEAEIRIGRKRGEGEKRWGSRVIDLDLLLYGARIINQPQKLIVPHPRMHQRKFVLLPLCEIAPKILHPVIKLEARQLLQQLKHHPAL